MTTSFNALARELIARLPSSTSSQLAVVRELEVAVIGRCTELESSLCVLPVVVAVRRAVGDTHPRDAPPPLPLPLLRSAHLLRVATPRPPYGTVTHIAGEAYKDDDDDDDDDEDDNDDEKTYRNGPALTARFNGIEGMVAIDGALYITDEDNHRIRKLHNGVASTHAGTGEEGFLDGASDVAQFSSCIDLALDSHGHLLVADYATIGFELLRWMAPRPHERGPHRIRPT